MLAFGQAESTDESLKALNFILEAWEEGTGERHRPGADGLRRALHGADRSRGRVRRGVRSISLVNGLVPRVQKGEFTLYRSRQ